jgi:serine/threonine protein kinase
VSQVDPESPDAAAIVFYSTPLQRDLSVSMNAASLMPSEESRRLRAVYAAALQRDPEERDDYLNRACVDQPELRAKVAALLQAHSKDFLETESATTVASSTPKPEGIEGKVIGPYIVRRELGRGGMGVVYLADDTRLSRRVALKALAPEVGHDPSRRERLRLEARAAAALSHPGIATVYALEEIGDDLYLAYEYVPGESLRALLASRPLSIGSVVTIGAQLARALAAAHTVGVIHRDIKPENVMKTPSGVVKILDFGLARVESAASPKLTQTGVIVGTPAYMAPEQVLGQHVDFRTDLFALGLLIYELASGVNPFAAKTLSGTFARIVEDEPPLLSTVRPHSLPELDRIVAKCLRKDPLDRYESTQDLVTDFEELESELPQLRHHGSDGRGHRAAAALESHSAQWWWELHQLTVSVIYVLMIYPAWFVQRWLRQPWGMLFLLAALASATASTSLRLHLRFFARHSPGELQEQLSRSRKWTRICDAAFVVSQVIAALSIGTAHPEFAMLLIAAATAMLVAALIIEPTTERAAFSTEGPAKWRCPSCRKWRTEPVAERCAQCRTASH